jgi:hypothetical protein
MPPQIGNSDCSSLSVLQASIGCYAGQRNARRRGGGHHTTRLQTILRQKGLCNVSFEVPIVADIPLNESRHIECLENPGGLLCAQTLLAAPNAHANSARLDPRNIARTVLFLISWSHQNLYKPVTPIVSGRMAVAE